jgi:alkylation response protein AidB-like acyl-CoA dehydrogenase
MADLEYTVADGIGTILLNRPHRKNAFTETGFAVVDAMMQILGGMGMTKDMPLEHWFRGLRVARVVEGPSEIHRFLIARDMLGGAALGRGA